MLAAVNSRTLFFRWYSSKTVWAKVLLLTTCLKASTSLPSPSTRAVRLVTRVVFLLFFLFCFLVCKTLFSRFSGVCQFWATFQTPPEGPKVPAGESFCSFVQRTNFTLTPTELSFDLWLFFPPLSDEWHGLGSCDWTHTGWHAVPCWDGRGRTTQPSVGRMNTALNSVHTHPHPQPKHRFTFRQ